MRLLTLVVAGAIALGGTGSIALAESPPGRPCAELELEFFPRQLDPSQAMDTDFALANCASFAERLVVELDASGPCPFLPSSRHVYLLAAGHGFGTSGLGFAPTCPGHYKVKGHVSFEGRVLDRTRASFTVHRPRGT